jgi:hypothetical protein
VFPRAWVVHDARLVRPVDEAHPASRVALIARLRSSDPSIPVDPPTLRADLRTTAYVEAADPSALIRALQPGHSGLPQPSGSADEVVIVREEAPTRVVIDASLQRPGIVVLADLLAPGWRLTIDDRPAPILRANLSMRAAAVAAGRHTLVYTYDPASVHLGVWISLGGLAALAGMIAWARPQSRTAGSISQDA